MKAKFKITTRLTYYYVLTRNTLEEIWPPLQSTQEAQVELHVVLKCRNLPVDG